VALDDAHNKRMQTDVAYGHAADAKRYEVINEPA